MTDSDGPTRRKFLTYGGSVAAGGLLAGCTGSSESDATATDAAATDTTATADATATSESTAESTADGSSYTVSMAPMGDVTFEGVP
ncbi:twin-arginine translocation signal domain-containing protein [Haloferax volcanii]|nr:twin-arginine translocation signal domain-containing protein [Haloferax lucentense]WEL27825.1 ABC-type Fe3 -hydroxamate transport system, periplasmic component [Haloferax lucentense]